MKRKKRNECQVLKIFYFLNKLHHSQNNNNKKKKHTSEQVEEVDEKEKTNKVSGKTKAKPTNSPPLPFVSQAHVSFHPAKTLTETHLYLDTARTGLRNSPCKSTQTHACAKDNSKKREVESEVPPFAVNSGALM